MDKNAIKKYAVWARRELIARISQKALQYGIEKDNMVDAAADSVNGKLLSADEKKQRQALIAQIKEKGFEQVMEEVAYTWFNRFSALRFMEVNNYLPSHVRVFTDEDNNFKPQIITEAIHLDLAGLNMEKVYEFKEADQTEELYKYLLIVQCNALNSILPGMFQEIADYTELLLPDNLLREGSVVDQMITMIPEEDWEDAVQIIGWLYQYYNAEKKDDVFAALKKNVKITKENIPAATQLFTPDWIVRYMVENSLGRLWLEGHPNDELKSDWKYYLDEAEQDTDVQTKIAEIRKEYTTLTPDQLKVIDPCCGSGHILAYMFDVLVQIYEAYGFTTREAVASIVENNIYGLDIDDRAAQLANFSVMMKARQYDRRFFSKGLLPHVYAIKESNGVKISAPERLGDERKIVEKLIHGLHDAKEYGSILNLDVTMDELSQLRKRLIEIDEMSSMGNLITMMESGEIIEEVTPLIDVAEVMLQKYSVVVTNPPYMGSKGMKNSLLDYIQANYPEGKADLYAAFIQKLLSIINVNGYVGLLTPYVWLYLSSFEKLRKQLISTADICSLVQLEYNAFEVACVPVCTFVLRKRAGNYRGRYIQLASFKGWENQEPRTLDAINNFSLDYCFEAEQDKFQLVAGTPIAYWLSNSMYDVFDNGQSLSHYGSPKQGMATADNGRFMRRWYEVSKDDTDFHCTSAKNTRKKWYPHSKGGSLRRWYGNNEFVINWQNDGHEIRNFEKSVVRNPDSYFHPGITWSDLTISWFTARKVPVGFTFDSAGPTFFANDEKMLNYYCGYFNSWVFQEFLNISCQGMHYSNGVIAQLPIIIGNENQVTEISELVEANIDISKADWDDFETSWDFLSHPLILYRERKTDLHKVFDTYMMLCNERNTTLTYNENRLDSMFASIFDMTDIVPSKGICPSTLSNITVKNTVIGLISYAVGCMFGRYSLDMDGLVYAGGEWDESKYTIFPADKDNVIPICDDEYFDDDIVGRFVKFIEVVYGKEALSENLKFVADALGGKGQPKDVIRNYFLNEFYVDHCKIYQKRPIYWLLDSGKKNGFKALVYMHRYQPDTIACVRTDYVHEQQARYRTAIEGLEHQIASAGTSERVKLNKRLSGLQAQEVEIRAYEEKIHHLADQMISIDLDDGVKKNYEIFKDILAKIK